MADKKISELNSLTGANAADGDLVAIVDVSATETKKITRSEFFTDTPSIDVGGTVTATGFVTTGDMTFGDNDKAIFGAGSDLQIYHSGADSFIREVGTGDLILSGNNLSLRNAETTEVYLSATTNGEVSLRYDNAVKLATTSTGVAVTGTITSDGLTVDNTGGAASVVTVSGNDQANVRITLDNNGSGGNEWEFVGGNHGANNADLTIYDKTNTAKRALFSNNGDISFYEDTGTTPKFFWDASAESLGIGTSSPARGLSIHKEGNHLQLTTTASGTAAGNGTDLKVDSSTSDLQILNYEAANTTFWTSGSERMRITSTGSVGIGTSSPSAKLHVFDTGSSTEKLIIRGPETGTLADFSNGLNANFLVKTATSLTTVGPSVGASLAFQTTNTERMRIDSSGNFLVGKTASGYSANGFEVTSTGLIYAPAGSASAPAITFSGDTNTGIGFGGADILYMSTGGTERMRITSSGNVGIGTTSPVGGLHINTATRSLNLAAVASGGGGASFLMMGNSDSGGAAGPSVIWSANRNLSFGVGNSFSDASGGTLSEYMRIDSSGRVGIGTSSPAAVLDVKGSIGAAEGVVYVTDTSGTGASSYPVVSLRDTNGQRGLVGMLGDFMHLNASAASTGMIFKTSNTERLRIDSSGNVLVGTTTSSGIVTGSSTNTGFVAEALGTIFNQVNAGPNCYMSKASGYTNGGYFSFYVAGSGVGSITTSGSATSYNTSSDYRLKEDVQPMVGASDRVLALNPVNFAWKANGSRVDGFLAHEAQEVVPEAVTGEKDAVDADGNPQYQGIDQSKLVPLLTAALQEALTEIADLKARVAALEA